MSSLCAYFGSLNRTAKRRSMPELTPKNCSDMSFR